MHGVILMKSYYRCGSSEIFTKSPPTNMYTPAGIKNVPPFGLFFRNSANIPVGRCPESSGGDGNAAAIAAPAAWKSRSRLFMSSIIGWLGMAMLALLPQALAGGVLPDGTYTDQPTTWSTTDTDPGIQLSNGNLTALVTDLSTAPPPVPSSNDGSTLMVGSGGSLVTAAGTWTFGTTQDAFGNTLVLLNGQSAGDGHATLLEVANGGQMFVQNSTGWYVWNGSGWNGANQPSAPPPPPPLPTASLIPNPNTIQQGQASSLAWSSTNATSCTGTGFDTTNAPTGSISVSPMATTNYGLSCTDGTNTVTASATLTVIVPPPVAILISKAPKVVVTWVSKGADSCTANFDDIQGFIAGNREFDVAEPVPGGITEFSITCTGPGGSVTATAPLTPQ